MLLCTSHHVRLYNTKPNKPPMSLTSSSLWSSQGTGAPIHINYLIGERLALTSVREHQMCCGRTGHSEVQVHLLSPHQRDCPTKAQTRKQPGSKHSCVLRWSPRPCSSWPWANLRNGHGCPLKTVLFLSPKYFSSFIRMRTLLKVSQQASLIHFTDERSKAQAS